MKFRFIIACCALGCAAMAWAAEPADAKFRMHRVGTYRGEACGVADFNNDGKLDIVALPYVYYAPDYKAVKVCDIQGDVGEDGKGYRWDFMNAPLDIDGDGWVDIATCSWFGQKSEWLKNPGKEGGQWQRALIEQNGNFECGDLWDIDGDGKACEILPAILGTVWYEAGKHPDGTAGVVKHVVESKDMPYGVGCGDVNGDKRPDILRPDAWFEAPADPRTGTWAQHPWALGGKEDGKSDHTAQMLVYDVNGDGLNDIVTSIAHDYGIFWYEQVKQGQETVWKRHVIDNTWSQAHSLALADINGDGTLDLVAGKRFMAHNGSDPGELEPLGVYWYELKRQADPVWTKHVITLGEGIGSGLNLVARDLDGDGDVDVVVTGKWGGPVWFENLRK